MHWAQEEGTVQYFRTILTTYISCVLITFIPSLTMSAVRTLLNGKLYLHFTVLHRVDKKRKVNKGIRENCRQIYFFGQIWEKYS